jgi:oxaloacetate decarboxylase alpha subunit
LVTPTSQIVGTQAVLNVLAGERYKMVTKESKGLLKGEYGRLPATPDADVVKKVLGDEKPITHRPADDIAPEYEKFKAEIAEYIEQEEDVLSYALFNQVAINFFKYRLANKKGVDKDLASSADGVYPV